MPKAYSYLRFSTPEQRKGDSARRQASMALEYAQKHGLELDASLTYRDLGVSAYRNNNARIGQLAEFLQAVEHETIKPGSFLLVESLDRLTRDKIVQAQVLFSRIILAGITIVTLTDNRVYSHASLNENPVDMITSLLVMMRAHEESKTKGRRIKEAWKQKRATGDARKLTKICPGWLKLRGDRSQFDVVKERAAVVKRIFRMTLKGIGRQTIARTLNEENIPAFNGAIWHSSYIAKLQSSPATIGTFVPHTEEHQDGKTIRKPAEAIPNYFPPVVTKGVFDRVQSLRDGARSPLRGRHASGTISNILGGLGRCPTCGGTVTVTNKGGSSGTWRYFICTKAKAGVSDCRYRTIPYGEVERAIIAGVDSIVANCPEPSGAAREIVAKLRDVEHSIAATKDAIEELLKAVERVGKSPVTVMQRVSDHEAAINDLQATEKALLKQLAAAASKGLEQKLEQARKALVAAPINRQAVNTALRQLLTRVVIDPESGELTLHWMHGGESSFTYRWFKPVARRGARR